MRKHPHRIRHPLTAVVVGLLIVGAPSYVPATLHAQTSAASLYEQAQTAEQNARAGASPAVDVLRKVAKSYESLVLRYPTSGYADNALWQAAGLFTSAFQQSTEASDRQQVERLLKWLRQEYPSSPFVKRVDSALQALNQAPAAASAASGTTSLAAAETTPPLPPPVPTSVPATPGQVAVVKSITETALPHGERITIEFSREVTFTGDRVDNPDRVFFDFPNSNVPAALIDHAPTPSGSVIKGLRVGRHANGVTRVVLELSNHPRYSTFPLYGPYRFVIDVEAADSTPAGSSSVAGTSSTSASSPAPAGTPALAKSSAPTATPSPTPKPTTLVPAPPKANTLVPPQAEPVADKTPAKPTPEPVASTPDSPAPLKTSSGTAASVPAPPSSNRSGEYSLSRQLGLGVSRIVVDAGHGGHDPGAQANGIDESELTLDVAQRLQKLLEAQPGFEVTLTRNTDEYIALEERTAIANRDGADLFISIHANASRQATINGIETYFLNFATNPTAEAVAARENASSGQTMGTLPDILKTIALNNKLAESRELASIVQTSLVRRLSVQNKTIRDLGVKQAPFVVLIGAQMPSILAEISFLTNHADAALLKQSAYRQRIAQALCDGIVKYQASLKKVTTVASRDGGR